MDLSNYARGINVLNTWALVAETSAVMVRTNFKSRFGEAAIASIGEAAKLINFGVLQEKFQDLIDAGASKQNPELSSIRAGMMNAATDLENPVWTALKVVGSTASSVSNRAVSVAGNVVDAAETGITATLKMLPFLIVGGLVIYALAASGQLKNVIKTS